MEHEGQPIPVYVAREGRNLRVVVEGRTFIVAPGGVAGRSRDLGSTDPPGEILAPLAGVVVEIRVAVGARIEAREVVAVVEAMKMQNEVQAALGGTVTAIHAVRGERVDKGDLLIEYEPDEAPPQDPLPLRGEGLEGGPHPALSLFGERGRG